MANHLKRTYSDIAEMSPLLIGIAIGILAKILINL